MIHKKKTKIVCTLGPATANKESITSLIKAGMNVARLNFSHDTQEEHGRRLKLVRECSKELGIQVAVLQDLCGPKIRIGTFKNEMITLVEGQEFTLTTDEIEGDENRVHVNYPQLPKEVGPKDIILIQDGKKKLEVIKVTGNNILCKVIVGGELKGRKGVNVPTADLSVSALTDKDKNDLKYGATVAPDFVALSFVRRPEDVTELRNLLNEVGSKSAIISKIETPQAVKNIDKIIELSDGIMIARGDLAIEIPAEDVPLVQKTIIKKCNRYGKPVIVATQMLESMINSPVPTRAEVSDIANAILDGTDAIMLSEETTLGKYPVEAVNVMSRVSVRTENDFQHSEKFCGISKFGDVEKGVADSVTDGVVELTDSIKAKFIVALTNRGKTARLISRYKPSKMVFALTPDESACRKLCLTFGCIPVLIPKFERMREAFETIRKYCLDQKITKEGEKVVVVGGYPFGQAIETNMVLVETI